MYTIEFAEGVVGDLAKLRASDRKRVLDRIERHLLNRPAEQTRNKKRLRGLVPPWEHEKPVWELRIGEYRVFYDVGVEASRVTVRAVRHKPPHSTTEEIL